MAAPGKTAKGRAQKLYLSTDGTTFSLMDLVADVGLEISPQMENVTVRRHGRANRQESYGYDLSASAQIRVPEDKLDSTLYTTMRDAVISGATVAVRTSNGTTSGREQITFWAEISQWSESDPIDGHVVIDAGFTATGTEDGDDFADPEVSTVT